MNPKSPAKIGIGTLIKPYFYEYNLVDNSRKKKFAAFWLFSAVFIYF